MSQRPRERKLSNIFYCFEGSQAISANRFGKISLVVGQFAAN